MWLSFTVSDTMIEKAVKIRQERDEKYGNIFQEKATDKRWVGDLGEIVFNWWLKQNGISGFQWHLNNAAGKSDFTINDITIDVKTVKRKVPPRRHYTAQITARHAAMKLDELFFCSYEFEKKVMWLLGGISKNDFMQVAELHKEGNKVHDAYEIREGHQIYNAYIHYLTPPLEWIKRFNKI